MEPCPLFDETVFNKLLEYGGPPFAIHMIDLFLDYVPRKLAEATESCAKKDWNGVKAAVHPIKSSAGSLGAQSLNNMAKEIELLAIEEKGEEIPRLVAELNALFNELKACLAEKKQALSGPS